VFCVLSASLDSFCSGLAADWSSSGVRVLDSIFKTFDYKSFSLLLTIFFVSPPSALLYSTISLFSEASFFSFSAGLAAAGVGVSVDPAKATGDDATGDAGAAGVSGVDAAGLAEDDGVSGSGA